MLSECHILPAEASKERIVELYCTRVAVVHLNFRACTVSPTHWVNKADTQVLAGATK